MGSKATSEILGNARSDDNGSVYEEFQLMLNLAVIEVLSSELYDFLLILGIFPFFWWVTRIHLLMHATP